MTFLSVSPVSTYFLFEKNVVEVATVAMRDQVVADYRDFFGKNCTDVEIELDHFVSDITVWEWFTGDLYSHIDCKKSNTV